MHPNAVVVFVRAPVLGTVKSRLAVDIGPHAALEAYRMMGSRAVAAVAGDIRWDIVIAHTPCSETALISDWLGQHLMIAQSGRDLGERMRNTIASVRGLGAKRVVVIGTDCPDISAAIVRGAFELLETTELVFGPASDGGYYLIAMNDVHDCVFTHVPWSSAETLAVSLEHAHRNGLSTALLSVLGDIDTVDDWVRWRERENCD